MEDELSRRNVDTSKFPLGEISPACIRAAYAALSAASAALDRPASAATDDVQRARDAQAIQTATNDFLRAIPHQVPRGGMAALRLDSLEIIRQKTDLVSTLEQILKRHLVAFHLLDDCLEFFQSLLKRHIVRGGGLLFFHSHAARKIVQLGQVDKRFGCSTAEAESQVAHPAPVAGRG